MFPSILLVAALCQSQYVFTEGTLAEISSTPKAKEEVVYLYIDSSDASIQALIASRSLKQKVVVKEAPAWVTSFPTFHWENEKGWRQLAGWKPNSLQILYESLGQPDQALRNNQTGYHYEWKCNNGSCSLQRVKN